MISREKRLLHLLELLYGSLIKPELWQTFVEELAKGVGATQSGLCIHPIKDGKDSVAVFAGTEPKFIKAYEEYYCQKNIWTERAKKLAPWGRVITAKEFCTDEELRSTEFYADWLRPAGMFHNIGFGFADEKLDVTIAINLLKSESDAPFGKEDMDFLSLLQPHLQLAGKLYFERYLVHQVHNATWSALDCLPTGVILVDSAGKIAGMNKAAEALVKMRDGLFSKNEKIHALDSYDDSLLRRLISAVATGSKSDARGGAVTVSRSISDRPLTVCVCPVCTNGVPIMNGNAVGILFVTVPDQLASSNPEVLHNLYGLTKAEVRLATALSYGKSLEELSEEFKISRQTARNHLKHIFMKTDTHRQCDLVRLVLTTPPTL